MWLAVFVLSLTTVHAQELASHTNNDPVHCKGKCMGTTENVMNKKLVSPKVIIFDVNETLLSLKPLKVSVGKALGNREDLLPLWFSTMLHYSLVKILTDNYHSFGQIGTATLMMVAQTQGIELERSKAETSIITALLAMSFFRDLMTRSPEDKTSVLHFAPFLLDNDSAKKQSEMSMCFYINQEKYILSIEFDKKRIYTEKLDYYGSNQPSNLYTRVYDEETDATNIRFGSKLMLKKKNQEALEGNTTNNCSVLAAFSKTNLEASQLNDVFTYFKETIGSMLRPNASLTKYAISSLDEDKSKRFILHFLQASDFNISDINVIKDEGHKADELQFTYRTDSGLFHLPEEMESRGTLRFLGIAFLLEELLLHNKILLVDEIESSLHYELLSFFIKVYLANSAKHSQLILTTHDIALLNEDYIRRDVIWFTDKDESGCTHLERLSSLGLHKALSPYNAYKQGKLVELPFLGSIYLNLDELCDEE